MSDKRHASQFLIPLLLAPLFPVAATFSAADAAVAPPFAGAFIQKNCAGCHNASAPSGGLDLTKLAFEPANPDNFATWVKVHDRVSAGEMPPAAMPRPAVESLTLFVKDLSAALTGYERTVASERGRARLRRLNAYEYENAVRDLLAIQWVQIKGKLPQDGESHRFNKIGGALDVSHIQLSRYMSTADYALREAMSAQLVQPAVATTRIYARQEPTLSRSFRPREGNTRTDRLNFPILDSHAQPDVRAGRSPLSSPENKEREGIGRVSSIFSDAGGFSWSSFRVPAPGRYRVKVKGYTIWVSGGGVDHWNFEGFGPQKTAYLYQPSYHRPNSDEVWPGRRNEPIGVYAQSSGQSRPLAEFDFTPEPSVKEVEVLLGANETIQTDAMRLFRTRVNGTEEEYVNPLAQKDGMPGVAFQWLEVEGPLYDQSAGAGYRLMFGDLPMRRLGANEPGGVTLQIVPPPSDANIANAPLGHSGAAAVRECRTMYEWTSQPRIRTRMPRASSAPSWRTPTDVRSSRRMRSASWRCSTNSSNWATGSRNRSFPPTRQSFLPPVSCTCRKRPASSTIIRWPRASLCFCGTPHRTANSVLWLRRAGSDNLTFSRPRLSGCSTIRGAAVSWMPLRTTGSTSAKLTTRPHRQRYTTTTNWTIRSNWPPWKRHASSSRN